MSVNKTKRWERGTAWWFGGRYLEKAWRSCNTLAVARCGAAVVSGWACFHLQSQNGEKPSCCFLVHLLIHERLFGNAGWWVMQDATRVEWSSWLFSCTELYCAGGKASWLQKHHFKFCVSPCIVSVFGFSGHSFMLSSSSVSLLCFFHTGPLRIFFSPPHHGAGFCLLPRRGLRWLCARVHVVLPFLFFFTWALRSVASSVHYWVNWVFFSFLYHVLTSYVKIVTFLTKKILFGKRGADGILTNSSQSLDFSGWEEGDLAPNIWGSKLHLHLVQFI